jgi:hypothetical protein
MIMVIGSETLSLVEMEAFLEASASLGFAGESRLAIYRWSESLLCHQEYGSRSRRAKGVIRGYMERMTGLSRAQCTRLIGGYTRTGRVVVQPSRRRRFPRRYTVEDVAALARVDRAHERLSGPATRHILKREFEVYGKAEYERLAAISNGHLYNLRNSAGYRRQGLHYEKTRPASVSIGERRKPAPNGMPGYLRMLAVETRGASDVAKRAHQSIGQIFRFAIARDLAGRNPAADFRPRDVLAAIQAHLHPQVPNLSSCVPPGRLRGGPRGSRERGLCATRSCPQSLFHLQHRSAGQPAVWDLPSARAEMEVDSAEPVRSGPPASQGQPLTLPVLSAIA